MATETIDHSTLYHLVEAGAVHAAHVIGTPDGWTVMVKYGLTERPLAAQRNRQVRLFKKLETLVNYLKNIGIAQFDVDASRYSSESLNKNSRPDRAIALKRAHEAAAYDEWFREQVQASINDPHPAFSHEETKRHFAARKDALRKG
ncbi:hypothetical protein ABLA30_20300 [Xenorhabdus nematophila]|uniref:Stability determinant domain-containing protein n=1 Tax=Xenorhabdus nematophila (strain ATCC 19061 / DSM 3370 / CCUG 14189 / LMG 1036 / NCIMB 9965 / AN6) TaxID=406817 RepID=D3VFW0_XENNA|nr:hypothetical protein [Xenorhabdus nematophila]CBJ92626.1 conserved hypothetical protein [Xenorhabdus nematophila ATCC 19061]CCW32789.1 conserved hypothetical protein [Xenorhabdus nematophila F1]CEE92022.1 putative counterpart of the neighbouring ParE-like protein [Xenorhabdus nematophila str. Anatoliense]CEK25433.1 putative counterpart of the neighbouring ParE-like protein [Xenorhabdus nematophila AN6/1]